MNSRLFLLATIFTVTSTAFAAGDHAGGHHGHGHHGHGGHDSVVGTPGRNEDVTRTVRVDLLDTMRFEFDTPLDQLRHGDVVRFVVTNRGELRHEFSIGSKAEQDAHRAAMRAMPDMVHDDPNAVTVEPGQRKVLIWRFAGNEPAVFACNIPGHAEAGMIASTTLGK